MSHSHIYDNWERLVASVLKREQFRQLCRKTSLSSSFSSISSDFSDLSNDTLIGQTTLDEYFQLYDPISFANNHLNSVPKPPTKPHVPPNGKTPRFSAPAAAIATYLRRRKYGFFGTGIPKVKLSELEAACEDFTNVLISHSSNCALFKGILSSGVEIAVASTTLTSARHWSESKEAQFRKKIDTLAPVTHKNFVNILAYCAEEKPFTRMMIFEYIPYGTLFEYLQLKEAVSLNWEWRLRIAMGVACCLEHLHQLTPPLAHRNLGSFAVYLTHDSAKLSDFDYWDEGASDQMRPNLQDNVSSFGFILLEMITGKPPHLMVSSSWLLDYLRGDSQTIKNMLDPTLETYEEGQLEQIGGVIKSCVNPNPRKRPSMKEVCAELSKITAIEPDGAIP